jgi:hypothetical protein
MLAFLLAIALVSPIPLAAQHEQEWTVVTLALDGSWGVGTSEHYGPALASALRKCEATSGGNCIVKRRALVGAGAAMQFGVTEIGPGKRRQLKRAAAAYQHCAS